MEYVDRPAEQREHRAEMRALGSRSLPTIVIDGDVFIGFSPHRDEIQKRLGVEAG